MSCSKEQGVPAYPSKVVVATGNAHKVVEIEAILSKAMPGVEFVSIKSLGDFPDPEETGDTFEENAFIKAQAAHEATGLPAVADDSGLEVDVLGGEPGVYSARYAGVHGDDDANNAKLEGALANVGAPERTARFVSCVAYVDEGVRTCGIGTCEGSIGFERRGTNGFGYDPLFLPDDTPGKTMAELSPEEKNAISHRFHALEALSAELSRVFGRASGADA